MEFDESIFTSSFKVFGIKVEPKKCHSIISRFKEVLLNRRKVRKVVDVDDGSKIVLLKEDISGMSSLHLYPFHIVIFQNLDISDLSEELQEFMRDNGLELHPQEVVLRYDQLRAVQDEVLSHLVPDGCTIPSSFETIGHIAHFNLRDELLPYGKIIGKVILDKNKNIRTVVNKVGVVDSQFREFKMKVIAGDADFMTTVKEQDCTFRFNFSDVYWNSRLQGEHHRIVDEFIRDGEIVVDMFAGVGPFSLPAAKRKHCIVLANDLNPSSFRYLNENIILNKLGSYVKAYNMDAREFIRSVVSGEEISDCKQSVDHVIMNLPASSLLFLDVIRDLHEKDSNFHPLIHCYFFSQVDESDEKRVKTLTDSIQCPIEVVKLHVVRSVSPNKRMICASFRVKRSEARSEEETFSPQCKKQKHN